MSEREALCSKMAVLCIIPESQALGQRHGDSTRDPRSHRHKAPGEKRDCALKLRAKERTQAKNTREGFVGFVGCTWSPTRSYSPLDPVQLLSYHWLLLAPSKHCRMSYASYAHDTDCFLGHHAQCTDIRGQLPC